MLIKSALLIKPCKSCMYNAQCIITRSDRKRSAEYEEDT